MISYIFGSLKIVWYRQCYEFSEHEGPNSSEALDYTTCQSQSKFQLACPWLISFTKVIAKYYYHCIEKEKLFSNYVNWYTICWLAMEPWIDVVVEVPLHGKVFTRINNQWTSNPSTVLKHQPTDSLLMGSSEVSSLVRISSADYYLVASVEAANSVGARKLPTWRGELE